VPPPAASTIFSLNTNTRMNTEAIPPRTADGPIESDETGAINKVDIVKKIISLKEIFGNEAGPVVTAQFLEMLQAETQRFRTETADQSKRAEAETLRIQSEIANQSKRTEAETQRIKAEIANQSKKTTAEILLMEKESEIKASGVHLFRSMLRTN
jgi:hypothetical protein